MLVHDVSPPVVLSREGFTTLSRIRATVFRTVEFPRLVVLIIDVTVKMGLGTKSHGTPRMRALVWSVVIAFVMTAK